MNTVLQKQQKGGRISCTYMQNAAALFSSGNVLPGTSRCSCTTYARSFFRLACFTQTVNSLAAVFRSSSGGYVGAIRILVSSGSLP